MRKSFIRMSLLSALSLAPILSMAQEQKVVLQTGTQLDLQAATTVMAKDVEVGDVVKFKVAADVKKDGCVLVAAGSIVDGYVSEAKKSSLAGTKGRLGIDIRSLILADGTRVPLQGNVRVSGKNRTPLAVITGLFIWPCIFIPGTKAVLVEGHNATATVLTNTEVPVGR